MGIEGLVSTILEFSSLKNLEWTSEMNLMILEFEKIEKNILKRTDLEILESFLNGCY